MVTKVLYNTGSPIKSRSMMYEAVLQAVLLYGIEIWVVMDVSMTVLEGFHRIIARLIEGMTLRKGDSGEWEWDLVGGIWR